MDLEKVITVKNLCLYYGEHQALKNISLDMYKNKVVAFIGPSGCGKSTFLRTLNRMNDLIEGVRITGEVIIEGQDIYAPGTDVVDLRKRVGMVFQRPNPFPMSIYDNIAYGPRIHGQKQKAVLDELVEKSLRGAALWDEVKDRLQTSAMGLSGGEILLMDEPCSALDPISTMKIEELLVELKEKYSIVMVTHNMQQAARSSDYTAFFLMGEMVECQPTGTMFTRPSNQKTEDYITGRFG